MENAPSLQNAFILHNFLTLVDFFMDISSLQIVLC